MSFVKSATFKAFFALVPAAFLSLLLGKPTTASAAAPAGYDLVWEDQFTGTALNDWWNILTGVYNGATRTADAVTVDGGYLTLTTYTEGGRHYTGFVSTRDKLQPRYGYIEVSMESTVASGINHAFWLQSPMNGAMIGDPWNAGMEIDVVEHRYSSVGPNYDKATSAIHWDGYTNNHPESGSLLHPSGLHTGFHLYALKWTPTELNVYIDGTLVWTVTNTSTPTGGQQGSSILGPVPQRSEFFYLTASVSPFSTSGAFAGFPLDPNGTGYGSRTASTTKMRIDYIKVYQLSSTTLPDAPTDVVATSDSSESATEIKVDLRWTLSANAESHIIKRSTTPGSGFQQIASGVRGNRYTDTTAVEGTTYYYVVTAVRTVGSNTYVNDSAEVSATPGLDYRTITVDNLDLPSSAIVGNWLTGSAGTAGVDYEGTNYLHDGDPRDGGGMSVTFTPQSADPLQVTTRYDVKLKWSASGLRALRIPVDIIHTGGTTTVYVDQTQGGSEWYQLGTFTLSPSACSVRIRNDIGAATGVVQADAVQFVQLPLPAPTGLAATAVSGTQIDLAWSASAGATSYTVKRATVSSGPYTNIASGVTATSYMDTGRTPNIRYYYVVSATNSSATSVNSGQANAITPLIMDNTDGGVAQSGAWTAATATSGYLGTNYLHDGNTGGTTAKSVTFTPSIGTTGNYEIYVRWTSAANRATNARFDVVHAGGTTTFTHNQTSNGGTWVRLGTATQSFTLNAGTSGRVIVRNNGANGYVVADGVKFVRQ